MKCALELTAIRKMADVAWAEEEAKKDAEARKDYKIACANTINFCDNKLDEIFTDLALKREEICYSDKIVTSKDRLGNIIFRFVKPDGRKYANGDLSYSIDILSPTYSWSTLSSYLHKHCFTIKTSNDSYAHYGWGTEDCTRITIKMA